MKKKVSLDKKQKKALTIAAAIGVSAVTLVALDRSPLGEKITDFLIRELAYHHIYTHKIGLYAVCGSYKDAIPEEGYEMLTTALKSIADRYL